MNISNDPLHGVKLVQIIDELVDFYGWEYMGNSVHIKCFINNPTVKSSLTFLRRTPWARTKVEQLYLRMLEEKNKK